MTEYERVRQEIRLYLNTTYEVAEQILAIDGIEIRADAQDLPLAGPFSLGEAENVRRARADMLNQNWVKVIPHEKT